MRRSPINHKTIWHKTVWHQTVWCRVIRCRAVRIGLAALVALAGAGLIIIDPAGTRSRAASPPGYVLAISWQPGFCETRPTVPECRTQTEARWDAAHFSLHGLWPQPHGTFYCGVDPAMVALDNNPKTWSRLPAVDLPADLRAALDVAMPGTRSALERHQWIKHGTCAAAGPARYFRDSLRLLAEVNTSPLRSLVIGSLDRRLSLAQVRTAADAHFGTGAGAAIDLVCRDEADGDRRVLTGLRLHLAGPVTPLSALADLLHRGPTAPETCDGAIVDRAGL